MTIAMLLRNTLTAARRAAGRTVGAASPAGGADGGPRVPGPRERGRDQISLFGGSPEEAEAGARATNGPGADAADPPSGPRARRPGGVGSELGRIPRPDPPRPPDPTGPPRPRASRPPGTSRRVAGLGLGPQCGRAADPGGRFPALWVVGEVANWGRVSSGHCYFSLRDEDAQFSCVMWRSDACRLPTHPEEGMEVRGFGEATLYGARGCYQLIVRKLGARGRGAVEARFREAQGEAGRRRAARAGAKAAPAARAAPGRRGDLALGSRAARRDHGGSPAGAVGGVLVSDCRVQGEEAAGEIVRALDRLVRHGRVEVIVVTRGGGSVEDLWASTRRPWPGRWRPVPSR